MVYADQLRVALTGRLGDWLRRERCPRAVMTFALLFAGLIGFGWSALLFDIGLRNMSMRFSLGYFVAYSAFVLFLGAWLHTAPELNRQRLMDGAPSDICTRDPGDIDDTDESSAMRRAFRSSFEHEIRVRGMDPRGLAGLAIAAAIIGVIAVAWHYIWQAPWHLAQMLIEAGKLRHRALPAPSQFAWLLAPIHRTGWAALILGLHYAAAGWILQAVFPQAVTIADVVRAMA